eukprot:1849922-Prymnesium_polylepis.1
MPATIGTACCRSGCSPIQLRERAAPRPILSTPAVVLTTARGSRQQSSARSSTLTRRASTSHSAAGGTPCLTCTI